MPRTVPEEKRELARKLIREGLTTREVAERAAIGVGTVTRMKDEMGMASPDGRGTGRRKLPQSVLIEDDPPAPSPPSAAALRLAAFDPLVAKAIRQRMNGADEPKEDSDD